MVTTLDALGDASPFDGFVEADFDAFQRKKWGSRVYTMERREARRKAVALARAAQVDLAPEALEHLSLGASDDAPSMANQRKVEAVWAFLTRPEAERARLGSRVGRTNLSDREALFDIATEHQHASLLFRVDEQGFQLEWHLSPRAGVDRMNAARKLAYTEDRAELLRLLSELPEAEVGFVGELRSAAEIEETEVEVWAERLQGSSQPLVVRRGWTRGEDRLLDPSFVDEVRAIASGLLAVHRHLAWAQDNDFAKVGVEKAVEKVEKKLERRGAKKSGGSAGPSETELSPGARVTILSGLFAGRSGYLAEPDGKGNVKVMVGPVSVSVPTSDVKPLS